VGKQRLPSTDPAQHPSKPERKEEISPKKKDGGNDAKE
jgi:hypothetical protein